MRQNIGNIYHIYALGFCGAEKTNTVDLPTEHRLLKMVQLIPQLLELGIDTLLLGPLFQSETHGYDTIDYHQVDRRLGTNEDLKALVAICHENRIKVILDCVFNHVGRHHFAFLKLRQEGQASNYQHWFKGIDFNKSNAYGDPFSYETWDGHLTLVKFNHHHQDVKDYLLDVASFWIETFKIDGLRMDAADVMNVKFLSDLSRATKQLRPDFWILGEMVGGDYKQLAVAGALDAVTNYECYKGLFSSLNDGNYFEIAFALDRQFGPEGIYKNMSLYNFVDNHDVNRVASNLKKEAHLYPLYILLYTMPGIPSIYYLSEQGQKGLRTPFSDEALRPAYNPDYQQKQHPLYQTICKLSAIRRDLKSLQQGDYQRIYVAMEQFAFMRTYQNEVVIVAFNASDNLATIPIEPFYNGQYEDVLNHETIQLSGKLSLHPNWGRILCKR